MADILETVAVAAIRHGTVIDHIPAGNALKIMSMLEMTALKNQITLGLYLRSEGLGLKDIIKIEAWFPHDDIHQVALFAPNATINIIRDYKVAEKYKAELPVTIPISKRFSCSNPKCISAVETVYGNFRVVKAQKQIKLRCTYCRKDTLLEKSDAQD